MPNPTKIGKDLLKSKLVKSTASNKLRRLGSSGFLLRMQEVRGSSPLISTRYFKELFVLTAFVTPLHERNRKRFSILKGFCNLVDKKRVSLPVISRLLRHKNLQTNERYLQPIDPRFRDTMRLLAGSLLNAPSIPTRNLLENKNVVQNS